MNSSYIQSDSWYVGVHVADDGTLLVYIDNDEGEVVCEDDEMGEDDAQWGGHFVVKSGSSRRSGYRIRPNVVTHRTMSVEVNK